MLHGGENALSDRAREFLGSTAWGTADCELLAGDASARKYFRLRKKKESVVLMDASQNPGSVAPFVHIDQHLRQLGFSTPAIHARDERNGLLLLEDFGDATFTRLLEGQGEPERLYALATDVLIALHKHPLAVPKGLRAYDPKKMLEDIELFLVWRTPGIS